MLELLLLLPELVLDVLEVLVMLLLLLVAALGRCRVHLLLLLVELHLLVA